MENLRPLTGRAAVAAAALAFAVIALPSSDARAQARVPTHVACVGDSITYGYLASSGKSYPSDLQAIFGTSVKVMNFGRNSATLLSTGDLPYVNQVEYTNATTFVSNAGASAVVDVIIMLGTNDTKSYNWMPTAGSTRAAQFMTDLAAMVDHFTGLSTHPVVYLALPPAIYSNSFGIVESVAANQIDPIIQQVATQKGMPVIDIHTPTTNHPEYFQDGVHPTDAGYMILAQLMHDGLLRVSGGTGGAGGGGGGGGGGAAGRGGAGGGGGAAGRGGASGAGGAGGGMAGRGGAAGGAAGGSGGRGGAGTGGGGTTGSGGATGGSGATAGTSGSGSGGTTAGTAGGGTTGSGGAGVGGGGTTGGSSATAGTAGGGTTGTGGGGVGGAGGSGGDGGGCGCSVPGGSSSTFAAIGMLLIALARRRRRR